MTSESTMVSCPQCVPMYCGQVRQGQAWEAYGYERGFQAGVDSMRSPLQGLILSGLKSQRHQNAGQAMLQVCCNLIQCEIHQAG